MNRFLKYVVVPCLVPLTFAACGKSNDGKNLNPIENINQAAKDGDLQGKIFRGPCNAPDAVDAAKTAIATGFQEGIKSKKEQYQVAGANITHATLFYSAENCADVALTYKEIGTIQIDEGTKTTDGGKNIDINYNKVTLTIESDKGLTIALAEKSCGKADWQRSQETDVTANSQEANCYQVSVPRVVRDVYLVENVKNDNNEPVRRLTFGPRKSAGDTSRTDRLDRDVKYDSEVIK